MNPQRFAHRAIGTRPGPSIVYTPTGKLQHWPTGGVGVQRELLAHELAVLRMGGDPSRTHAAPQWRRVAASLPG